MELICPRCNAHVFQCLHCEHRQSSVDPKDISGAGRTRRTLHQLVKEHVAKYHTDKFEDSTSRDDCCVPVEDGTDLADIFHNEDDWCGPAEDGTKLTDIFHDEGGPREPLDCNGNSASTDCGGEVLIRAQLMNLTSQMKNRMMTLLKSKKT